MKFGMVCQSQMKLLYGLWTEQKHFLSCQQGVYFATFLHESRALSERKEMESEATWNSINDTPCIELWSTFWLEHSKREVSIGQPRLCRWLGD